MYKIFKGYPKIIFLLFQFLLTDFRKEKIYLISNFLRSSRSQIFCKIGVLKKLHKIHRKTPLLESVFNKVAGLKAWNFIKKRLQQDIFLWILHKFSKSLFTEHLQLILLADSSVPTKVLFIEHSFFLLPLFFFFFFLVIAIMGICSERVYKWSFFYFLQ